MTEDRVAIALLGCLSILALVVGGILFTVSDALIVHRRLFLTDERQRRTAEAVILSTYVAAQMLLVDALATTRRRRDGEAAEPALDGPGPLERR